MLLPLPFPWAVTQLNEWERVAAARFWDLVKGLKTEGWRLLHEQNNVPKSQGAPYRSHHTTYCLVIARLIGDRGSAPDTIPRRERSLVSNVRFVTDKST